MNWLHWNHSHEKGAKGRITRCRSLKPSAAFRSASLIIELGLGTVLVNF